MTNDWLNYFKSLLNTPGLEIYNFVHCYDEIKVFVDNSEFGDESGHNDIDILNSVKTLDKIEMCTSKFKLVKPRVLMVLVQNSIEIAHLVLKK